MKRFVEGVDRGQGCLFPEQLEDWVGEDNPVRVIDVFVDELELGGLGFDRVEPKSTGRPGYHPSDLLKLYIYGYLNRVQSSRRLEREAGRNVEVMWLTGRLVPDYKTIADFRKDYGGAIRKVCAQFVGLCRRLDLFADASVRAIKGGAVELLEKPFDDQALMDAINTSIEKAMSSKGAREEMKVLRHRVSTLTPREYEVFQLVVRGMLNKQIAMELGISEKTVKVHRARVMEKMQVEFLAQLVRLAERLDVPAH